MKFCSFAIFALTIVACGASGGVAARSVTVEQTVPLTMMRLSASGETEAPIGHVQFCYDHPAECRGLHDGAREVFLSKARWRELYRLNKDINSQIQPLSDKLQYDTIERWTYPDSGKGDCEDYVILKKRKLIESGWPARALLITVVRDENDEGHAVLMVRTHRGDLILDNKHSRIEPWHNTPYTFIKRQSANDQSRWEALVPQRVEPTISASGSETR